MATKPRRAYHPNRMAPFVAPKVKPAEFARRGERAAEELVDLMRAHPEIERTVRATRSDPVAVRALELLGK